MIKYISFAANLAFGFLVVTFNVHAQADDICREIGETPTREIGRDNRLAPYVFGKVTIRGAKRDAKPPRVTVIYSDSSQPATRQTLGKSGNYCFKRFGNSGTLIIDVDGIETARKSVSDIGGVRQREDFEVIPPNVEQTAPPSVVSSKFNREPNEKTVELYKKLVDFERDKKPEKMIEILKEIVAIDPADFIGWYKLGTLQIGQNAIAEAEASFKQAIAVRRDYVPAMLNLGILRAVQNQHAAAVEIFEHAVAADPTFARSYRLLGEAYFQVRRGSDGLSALDEALRLDPQGMAECHLLKARLYDLAGAKNLAAIEYKAFLAKVQDHPDKKKFEKYIKDNP